MPHAAQRPGQRAPHAAPLLRLALHAALLLTALCVYAPWGVALPAAGLDASWRCALDRAHDLGLIYGRGLVFTFGPYFGVANGIYNVAFAQRDLLLGLGLGLAAWAGVAALARPERWRWTLGFMLALAATGHSDTASLLLPFLFSLLAARAASGGERPLDMAAGALLLLAMSLLALVKVSALAWLALAAGGACLLFLVRGRWAWAGLCAGIPLATVPLLWIAAGQPLAALPDFLKGSAEIIGGYNQAMQNLGDVKETILLVLASGFTLWWILRRAELALLQRVLFALVFAAFLFLALKMSVVRHDAHALVGGRFALLAPLLLGTLCAGPRLWRVALFGLMVCLYVDSHYSSSLPRSLAAAYAEPAAAAATRLARSPQELAQARAEGYRAMAQASPLPPQPGRVDLYPSECSLLAASDMQWSPRPVFQSYSAYTPYLAELNRRHLLGPKAPDTVFFHVDAIDRRYPALEDGPSWPELLTRYAPDGFAGDYALLRRKAEAPAGDALVPLAEAEARLNEPIAIPESDGPVFVVIDMTPTLAGRLASLAYKYDRVKFDVELADGGTRKYRLPPVMGRAGFVVSPLVESGRDFAALYPGQAGQAPPRVRSMRIIVERLFGWQWQDAVRLRFYRVDVPRPADASAGG